MNIQTELNAAIGFTNAFEIITILIVLYLYFLKKCKHISRVTRTFNVTTNCEETAEFCQNCGKQLTQFKTDCR